ncbi:hypothetical protein [Vibrio sp. SCSIO 43136]|uniref:hypothetical protein n=1 Tax=Vibrio sp. SCSIO 43136 TaxID=2819101 RepID=UPI0020761A15|nr:hypothetical protein [Vibrio sp. SCSIO 43136]USD64230.1 hypothetical protein J4N39_08915 [Vibrio sp. SCSIO 43136]
MVRKQPEGRAERYVSGEMGFNLRQMRDEKARREFKSLLTEAIAREQRGELVLPEELRGKALPKASAINTNDLARQRANELGLDKPENFRTGSVFQRIAERARQGA